MIALVLLIRIALLSGALWLVALAARRERLAVRRTAALGSLLLLALVAPASLWLRAGLLNFHSAGAGGPTTGAPAADATLWMAGAWALTAVYLAGVAVGLTRFGLGLVWLARLRPYPAPRHSQKLLRAIAPADRRPRLFVSRDCRLPFSTQWLPGSRGRIVLPSGLIGATDRDTLAAILRHEYRHLQSNDPWWSLLSRLLCALFWPVPFVHALSRELDTVQEAEADEAAIAQAPLPQKALYAECLIALAARPGLARPVAVICAAVGRSFHSLEGRIRSILAGAERPEASGRRIAVRRRLRNYITALVVVSLPVIFVIGVSPAGNAERSRTPSLKGEAGLSAPASLDDQEAALRIPISHEAPPSQPAGGLLAEELSLRAGL